MKVRDFIAEDRDAVYELVQPSDSIYLGATGMRFEPTFSWMDDQCTRTEPRLIVVEDVYWIDLKGVGRRIRRVRPPTSKELVEELIEARRREGAKA